VIVLVMVIIVAIILWLLDMFFLWGIEALIRPGG
jgi:preprotein translocase subunit SecE